MFPTNFGCIITIAQWCVLHWGPAYFMVENFVHNVTEESESKTSYRFQTHCEFTFVIQSVCLPRPWTIGTCFWCTTSWRTAWFRAGRPLEEHPLSANILLDKAQPTGLPVWVISLDLSKALDWVHWPALSTALLEWSLHVLLLWGQWSSSYFACYSFQWNRCRPWTDPTNILNPTLGNIFCRTL